MKTIRGKKWYRPREIADAAMITNSRGEEGSPAGRYAYVLRLIRSGRLAAKNYSTGDKVPYWLVPEDEIERYNRMVERQYNKAVQ